MPLLITLGDARDIVVIAYGIAGLVFFFIAIIVLVVLVFSIKGLIGALRSVLDESVKPTLESVKNTADTVRGTTEFVGKTAIAPIVRTYGMFAGVRKGLGVLTGLQKKGK
jgi:hypothetical protein